MKKLNILIVKSFIGPFLATFCISMFLFLMHFLWKYVDEFVGKGLEWHVVARLLFFTLAELIPLALPLAVLISSLMTYGNLGETFEMVAIKSSGISLPKALRPAFGVMVFLSIAAFWVSNFVIPRANLEAKSLLWDVRNKKPAFDLKEGVFYNEIDGFSIKIGKKDKDNQTIHNILIYQLRPGQYLYNVIKAEKGYMRLSNDKKVLYFTLFNGIRYEEMTDNKEYFKRYPHNTMQFQKHDLTFDLTQLDLKKTEKELFRGHYKLMNIYELQVAADSMKSEVHKRNENMGTYLKPYFSVYQSGYNADSPDSVKVVEIKEESEPYQENIEELKVNLPLLKRHKPVADVPKRQRKIDSTYANLSNTNILMNYPLDDRSFILESAIQSVGNMKSLIEGNKNSLNDLYSEIRKFKVEWHKKFTLSILIIILFFIAAPLGTIIRKGGLGMPLVISILMFILYYVLNMIGEKMGKEAIVPEWVGAWLSTFILFPVGAWITYKASIDSAIFDSDVYKRFFRRVGNYFNKNKQLG